MSTSTRKFSPWLIVAGCFIMQFFSAGIISSPFGLFMAPICGQFGFSVSSFSVINLVSSVASAAGAILLAPKFQKGNMKMIMVGCAVVTGISYGAMAFCTQLWQFFILFGVSNLALAGLTQMPVSLLLTNWFNDNRPIAMSIAFSGTSMGGAFWSMVFGRIIAISDNSWINCFFLGAAMLVIVASLVAIIFIKRDPASVGQKPYTSSKAKSGSDEDGVSAVQWLGVDKKTAIKTMPFVATVLVVFFIGTLAAGVVTHLANYLVTLSWATAAASAVLSIYSLTSILGKFAGGFLFEKLGIQGGMLISIVFAIIGLCSLMFASSPIFAYLFALAFAMAMSLPQLAPATLTSTVFGVKDYASIYSMLNMFFLLGCALGSVITGVISDMLGYRFAWGLYVVFCVLIALFTAIALRGGKKLKAQYPNPVAEAEKV